MNRVSTYIVYWEEQSTGERFSDYVQALNAINAVKILGIPEECVIEVAKVIKDWRKA